MTHSRINIMHGTWWELLETVGRLLLLLIMQLRLSQCNFVYERRIKDEGKKYFVEMNVSDMIKLREGNHSIQFELLLIFLRTSIIIIVMWKSSIILSLKCQTIFLQLFYALIHFISRFVRQNLCNFSIIKKKI